MHNTPISPALSTPTAATAAHSPTAPQPSAWSALTTVPDALGESPFWHAAEQRLYWADIAGKRLARVAVVVPPDADTGGPAAVATGPVEHWALPEEPGCVAPVQGGGLVLALRSGVYLAPVWGGPLAQLAPAPYDTTRQRFNDGRCDPQGRFWAGSLYEPKDQPLAALYVLQDGQMQLRAAGATTANGLSWSPDGRTLYWADTPSHAVRAWDFDPASAALTRGRVWHQCAPKPAGWTPESPLPYGGRPDGAAVDAEGAYWSAQYEGGRLLRLSASGQVLDSVATPMRCPTMPCLGGPDGRTLFVTSASQGRSDAERASHPGTGCVFARRVAVAGLPVNAYRP